MDTVTIQLCILGNAMHILSLPKKTQVAELLKYIPSKECSFIYSGNIMKSAFSLDFYGVRDEDMIVAIHGNSNTPQKRSSWMKLTQNDRSFFQNLSNMANPAIANELCRLQDIRMMVHSSLNPKFYHSFNMVNNRMTQDRPIKFTPSKYTKPDAPTSTPLPMFWQ